MNKFKLSTDIISPIHSDISLNDSSVFSYGSVSDIPDLSPDFRKKIDSLKCESLERDSSVDSYCKTTLKESAAAFDAIVNDIKKQSNINADREERYKESYSILKHSMDKLCNKVSHPSVLSPVSSDINFEKKNWNEKTVTISEMSKKPKQTEKNESTKSKTVSQISSKKSRVKEESKLRKKDNNQHSKNSCLLKESTENSKHCKNKAGLQSEIGVNESNSACGLQNPNASKTVSSSTQTCEYFEVVGANRKENLKKFYMKKQREPVVSNSMPATENKNSSIETSIQIAISMEMDNLRRFMLEQSLCLRKDLQKLKETAEKQREVKGYLFSVIEGLMEENKKLISNKNKF